MAPILYTVIPCYKEEEVLPETAVRLLEKFKALIGAAKISTASKIMFVNDGSGDKTWEIIRALHEGNALFSGINLSKNRGHQNALLAGLMTVKDKADVVISMDADLQDDIHAIDKMLEAHAAGYDIVYGVRSNRKKDSIFKRMTAEGFYKMMRAVGVDIIFNHADYRLMTRRALDGLAQFKEVNLFLRGIVPMIGYPTTTVFYERAARFAGESKYPLRKMLTFAFEGITSLSIRPIRLISMIGLFSFIISLFFLVYFIFDFMRGGTAAGWASTIVSIWAIGGLQLLAIGIIGEYIGKVYLEVKERPRFIIAEVLNKDEDTDGDCK